MSIQAVAWVLEETGGGKIGHAARLVLLSIANHANAETGEAWPGKALIAREADVSVKYVRKYLRELEDAGFLETIPNGAFDERIPPDKRPNLYKLRGYSRYTPADGAGVYSVAERGGSSYPSGGVADTPQTVIEPLENRGPNLTKSDLAKSVRSVRSHLR